MLVYKSKNPVDGNLGEWIILLCTDKAGILHI